MRDHFPKTFNLKDISSEGHFSKDEILETFFPEDENLGAFREGHFCEDILVGYQITHLDHQGVCMRVRLTFWTCPRCNCRY